MNLQKFTYGFIFPIFDYPFVINLSSRSHHPVRKYIVNSRYTIHTHTHKLKEGKGSRSWKIVLPASKNKLNM